MSATTTFTARRHSVLPWINLSLGVAALTLAAAAIKSDDTGTTTIRKSPTVLIVPANRAGLMDDVSTCDAAPLGQAVQC